MTSEPKLLDPSAIDAIVDGLGLTPVKRVLLLDFLRERGLIAPEPDAIDRLRDALEAIHGITLDRDKMARVCREARMELRPPLTRERVREALLTVWDAPAWAETYAPRLHAALTDAKGGE